MQYHTEWNIEENNVPENTLRFRDLQVGTLFVFVNDIYYRGKSAPHIKTSNEEALNLTSGHGPYDIALAVLDLPHFEVCVFNAELHKVRQ